MSEKYLGEVSTPLLINQIKENCAQKRTTLPVASADELGKIYQYMGATSGSLVHGYFYECVSDGQNPATYSWQQVNTQPTPATPTASGTTFNNTTSGLQATNVQDAIDEVEGRVDNIEGIVPSTATSSNQLVDHDSLGTAAFKDSTDRVSPNNTALVESQSVYSAINTALSSIYTPRGDITCAELTSDLLIAANVGNIYETSDSGTTSALFLQGAGVPIPIGSNVGIINAGQGRILFNLMANAFDLTDYQKKDLASTIEGATTVEGALSALSTNKATQAEVNDIVNVLGAKNLLPNNVASKTLNGVTFTVNNDRSVTINGTATSTTFFYLVGDSVTESGYKLSGRFIVSTQNYISQDSYLRIGKTAGTYTNVTEEKVVSFSENSDIYVVIRIASGEVIDNVTLYPMLRLASDPDNTYVPYTMTNQQMTPYVQAISNTNLLDNPWFTVNQRGFSSKDDNGFTVDRWQILQAAGTVSLSNGVITIDPTVSGTTFLWGQTIEDALTRFAGKTLTLSVLLSDGTIKSKAFEYPTSVSSNRQVMNVNLGSNHYFEIYAYTSGHARCGYYNDRGTIPSSPLTIKAVKLEVGSVSTLAMDTAPSYATELVKCQRYFQRIKGDSTNKVRLLFGLVSTTTTIQVQLPFAVPMRISNATITYSTNGILYGKTSTTTTVASDISLDPSSSICRNCLVIGTGLTVGETMPIYLDVGAYIDLSADL